MKEGSEKTREGAFASDLKRGAVAKVDFRELLAFAAPHRATIVVALVLGILGSLAALAQPLAVGGVLEAVRTGGSVVGPATLLAALFVVDGLLSGFQAYLMGKTGEDIVFDVRRTLVGRLLRMTVAEHDRRRAGDLLSRVGTDTTLLKTSLAQSLANVLIGTIVFVGALAFMAAIDLLLLAVALLCVLVATVIILLIAAGVRRATEEVQESVGSMVATLERALRAVRTVKISRSEEREEREISGRARAAYRAGVRAAGYEALVGPATSIVLQGSFVLVLGVGGARLASGQLALEELVTFLLYLLYLTSPLVLFFVSFTDLQQGFAAVGRIKEILSAPVEEAETRPEDAPGSEPRPGGRAGDPTRERGPRPEPRPEPVVRFEAVSFGYEPGHPVLREASFEVSDLALTALVGPSGSGKSTVFALLERFYEPDSGEIALGGTDLRELPLETLRGEIGYVEQNSPVMAGSIRENLLYAEPEATAEELEEALDLANLRRFVERLPRGLDAEVGDGGVLLSGGERQRLAIARMLLTRPRLLLLDEVTSQLDAENERALRETISRLVKRCAVVAIAHRLSTVREADEIVVLDEGRVEGIGTHDELMKANTIYRRLVETQMIDAKGEATDDRLGESVGRIDRAADPETAFRKA